MQTLPAHVGAVCQTLHGCVALRAGTASDAKPGRPIPSFVLVVAFDGEEVLSMRLYSGAFSFFVLFRFFFLVLTLAQMEKLQ